MTDEGMARADPPSPPPSAPSIVLDLPPSPRRARRRHPSCSCAEIVALPAPVEVLVTAAPGAVLLCRRLARAVLQVWELDDDQVHAAETAVRDLSEQVVRTAPAASRLRLVLAFAWPLLTAEAGIVGGASVVEYVDVTGRVLVARGAR